MKANDKHDPHDLNQSLALVTQYKNYFRTFERAEEFLRSVQSILQQIDASERRQKELSQAVAELEEQLQVSRGREAEARAQAEKAEAASRERIEKARQEAQAEERKARENATAAVERHKADANQTISALEQEIWELTSQRDEELRLYNEVKERREELLRQLRG